ncbi:hypothetical protein [Planctomicrobium sp. SH664]|uniref:hypothetical protein n=1 Tax=Planctomicrobium sp. SH664 TaxID=3448125 RepID=UPI003F5B8806
MRLRHFIPVLLVTLGVVRSLSAVEPVEEFLAGLQQRRYFDTALSYLDQLAENKNLDPALKAVLPYERGQVLLRSAQDLVNLDAQRKQLDAAQLAFEQFVKQQPTHPLAARANTARGRILLEKARVEIWDSERGANQNQRSKFRESAKLNVQSARRIFEQARDQYLAAHARFPTHIPEEDRVQRAARDAAEAFSMEAQLDLAECLYWEAQIFDPGSKERKDRLDEAGKEFEQIHQKFRTQIGGLFARMWQGKCFEEQGNVAAAEGIYSEILAHDDKSEAYQTLKDRALRFRLICLNHDQRKQYTTAADEADRWLKSARTRARTDVGLGIQWELCRAQEALGNDRNATDAVKKSLLNQALSRARDINRYPGELKVPSSAMIQRIMGALNRATSDPKDFDSAYSSAGQLWEEVKAANSAVADAKSRNDLKSAQQHQATLQATSAEMSRLYELALRLAPVDADAALINLARIRLSYGYLLQQRFFDAAAIAEYQMIKYGEKYPEVGAEGGFLALTAFDHAYNSAPENDRSFERRQLTQLATTICNRWPQSDRANDARNAVAKVAWQAGDLQEAARWWNEVPADSSQYADSQARAGKAFWRQYVLSSNLRDGEPASPEQLQKWKAAAVQHLENALAEAERSTSPTARLSDEMVGAKLTLVSIRNLDGIYTTAKGGPAGAIELLTKDPHPVIKMVEPTPGQKRPTNPAMAQSRQMASSAWQQLLRAQIGVKDLDAARKARQKLEEVAGGENNAALTQVFVDFGKELEQELTRLQASGETKRLADVRAGFEKFLNDLFERKEGQTFYSLLWIAETYSSLAEGSRDSREQQRKLYEKSAVSYQSILDRAAREPDFARPEQITACKLRLVNCLRLQHNFSKAEPILLEVMKTSPQAPDVQFAAAQLYQEWGESGGDDAEQKFAIALYGRPQPVHVWGWNYAAQSLQRATAGRRDERLEQMHFDARYHLANSEYRFGKSLKDAEQSRLHLDRALAAITGFRRISANWPDTEYARFNTLYKRVLADTGGTIVDLPRQTATVAAPAEQTATANSSATASATPSPVVAPVTDTSAAPVTEPPPAAATSPWMLWGAALMVLGGLAYTGYTIFRSANTGRKGSRSRSVPRAGGPAPNLSELTLPPELLSPGPTPPRKVRPATARKPGPAAPPNPRPPRESSPG